MKLAVKHRVGEKKKDIKDVRRAGDIPAVIYSSKGQPEKLVINGDEFKALLRGIISGQLPTTVFVLHDGKKDRKAIIKDIQYNITSYGITHIDFAELTDGVKVKVKVPVNCTGVAECQGVKLGGFLRQVERHVEVECDPKHLPSAFSVDVRDLGIRQSRRLRDIALPAGVRALAKPEKVLVVVAKR
jgi:large subunit ribosomal protein L25